MKAHYLLGLLLAINLTACEKIALLSTPEKKAIPSTDAISAKAENYFWQIIHEGRYEAIEKADRQLMIAYLKNPNDPQLAAHIGFLHMWKITERDQSVQVPLITNEIILANKYFSDAVILAPKNAVYEGFLGDAQLVQGQIFKDKREQVRGYFTLKRAIAKWPEFNYFTAGYPMSTLPPSSTYYQKALEWQWLTLDLCAGKKVNRQNPDFRPYMRLETHKGKQRACWNSWAAPHNFEGFFLNMGDMLVKAGNWQAGILIYKNAQLANSYSTWPFRGMLEKRILNAKSNVEAFQKNNSDPDRAILFNSGNGCMACHQKI